VDSGVLRPLVRTLPAARARVQEGRQSTQGSCQGEENLGLDPEPDPELYKSLIRNLFAPWCGHCQQLVPEYKKAAKALKGVVKVRNILGWIRNRIRNF
jgi:thiol-disulfide isomerase/thioredoxin